MTTDGIEAPPPRRSVTLNRKVLISYLISGVGWVIWATTDAQLTFLGLPLIAAVYVVVVSVFFSVVYAKERSDRHWHLAWIAPWLVAVGLWIAIGLSFEIGSEPFTWANLLFALYFGFIYGTGLYVVWQVPALILLGLLSIGKSQTRVPRQ